MLGELRTLSEAVHNQHISSGVNEKAWAFYKFFKSKRRGRLGHTKVEKSQFVAANKRLEESLQPQDDGFIFTQWTAADEAFTALLATAGGGIEMNPRKSINLSGTVSRKVGRMALVRTPK